MKFTVHTIQGRKNFNHVKGLMFMAQQNSLVLVNESDEPITQYNPDHIIEMHEGHTPGIQDNAEGEYPKDVPAKLIQIALPSASGLSL